MLSNICGQYSEVLAFVISVFKELVFKLPEDNGHVLGEPRGDITQEPLRFAVHPGRDRPMIAMATANYEDLKIMVCINNVLGFFRQASLFVRCIHVEYIY